MQTLPLIEEFAPTLIAIRRDLHEHPETGFEEDRTSDLIASLLASWDIEVHRDIGGTGVVGVLEGQGGEGKTIGLRADMDALPIQEETSLSYRSKFDGRFHGCGHDGHVAILLGAARYLAETRDFPGRVIFIFQPAEEGLGGAKAMLEDGLFTRFPCDRLYGFHNWPELDLGQVAVIPGACMAGADFFDIEIKGRGGHGGMPQQSSDPIVAAAHLVTALQSIVSRAVDPVDPAVISITRISSGHAYNVIPSDLHMSGSLRFFSDHVRDTVVSHMRRIVDGCASTFNISADLSLRNVFGVTINDPAACGEVRDAARYVVGDNGIAKLVRPTTSSEDFSEMLAVVPGAYFFIGHGGTKPLHHPQYLFDDNAISIGASILSRLVESFSSHSPAMKEVAPGRNRPDRKSHSALSSDLTAS